MKTERSTHLIPRLVILPLLLGALASLCSSCIHRERFPIEDGKLVQVLADLHVAEAALVSYELETKDSIASLYYRDLSEIHGIKREDLDTCIAIMRRDPELMMQVYDAVLQHLEAEKLRQ